jgi:acetylornithine deacetylase
MALTALEHRVVDAIAERRDEIVALASELIGFDTTARDVGDPPRDEAALQHRLADRLSAAGAETEVWEPSADELAGQPIVPPGIDFQGRPQMTARFTGAGRGRTLLYNGHIDVVSVEPRDQWTTDPHRGDVREGRLYGRGACDMKGGIAAMTVAAETLASLPIELAGNLIVATNTDEESSGAGGMALVAHGVRADGAIVPEPTGFDTWIACRGSTFVTIQVPGRPGHAEIEQPPWHEGGAVNAIEKATIVLAEIERIRADWRSQPELRHPYLPPADIVPTMFTAGEWGATYPSMAKILCTVPYLPIQADADGWNSRIREEVEARITAACRADDWLASHPPLLAWSANVMPMELSPEEPIVTTMIASTADVGRRGILAGLNSWFDGATFSALAATPAIAYGPAGRDGTRVVLHAIDEYVPVDDLVVCSQGLAVAALRFCGQTG